MYRCRDLYLRTIYELMSQVLMDDLHPTDDHSHKFFIWPEWIAANGPLTAETAFEYFTTSMFYDKQSNNQVLRMQTIHTGLPLVNEQEELKRFTGIEFALVHAEPPLFIIHKRHRFSKDEVRPLVAYFILHNRIYQSPDVYSVLSNRLLTTLNALQSSLETLRKFRPEFAPRTGFVWPIVDDQPATNVNKSGTRAQSLAPSNEPTLEYRQETGEKPTKKEKKHENFMLMLNAMNTTAAYMKKSSAGKLSENLAATEETPPGVSSPSSNPLETGIQVDTPETISSSQLSSELITKEGAPPVKKKRKKTLPHTPAPQTPA